MPKGDEWDFGDLTHDDAVKIQVDYMLGRPQRIKGPDAEKFLAAFKKDVEKAKKDGLRIEIPVEIEPD